MIVISRSATNDPPISLAEAKKHLRIEHADEDSLIRRLIASARDAAEQYLERALVTQTRSETFNSFCDSPVRFAPANRLTLPGGRVSSTQIQYKASDTGTLTTLASSEYELVSPDHNTLAYVVPAYGKAWPTVRAGANAVQVTYVVGYGDTAPDELSSVPQAIISAMHSHIAHAYENRELISSGEFLVSAPAKFQLAWERVIGMYRLDVMG